MDPLEMMDEVQFEDFSVMEEIELDEDGEEVNRILTENVHPYDNGPLIGNGDDDQDNEVQSEDFGDALVISTDSKYLTMEEESLASNKWSTYSNKVEECILQQNAASKQSALKKGESVLKLSQPNETVLNSLSPTKPIKTQSSGESLLKSYENETTVDSSKPDRAIDITGLKVKQFTSSELEAFKKPFDMGWRRELVLRGTVTSTGKKIGDVYYFSPDKNVKLRSYVEMGSYLKKHPDCDLEPENFTFARQPIYQSPFEIVRHANPRSRNESTEEKIKAGQEKKKSHNKVDVDAPCKDDGSSVKTNNSKRKRTAPSRFEDEDHYEQSPFKKKAKGNKSEIASKTQSKIPNGTSKGVTTNSQPSSLPEKTYQEQKQTSNDLLNRKSTTPSNDLQKPASPLDSQPSSPRPIHSHSSLQETQSAEGLPSYETNDMKKEVGQTPIDADPDHSQIEEKPVKNDNDQNPPQQTSNGQKSDKPKKSKSADPGKPEKKKRKTKTKTDKSERAEKSDKTKTEKIDLSVAEDVLSSIPLVAPAPCSIMCNGKKGMLPNLLCGRCLCLFHPECVPSGIYLDDPHRFICPNCINPSDLDKQVTSVSVAHLNPDLDFLFEQRLSRGGSVKGPSTISKHPSYNDFGTFPSHQDHLSNFNTRNSSNINSYRFSGFNDHHFSLPIAKPSRIDNHRFGPLSSNPHLGFNSLNIAPIAPIKYSPNRVADIIQEQLNRQRSRICRVKPEISTLTNGYECLLHVFKYLNVRDLIRVKQVSRIFNLLASHPSLWHRIKLKGLAIKDWQYFGRNVVETLGVEEIDFEGLRLPQGVEPHEMWSNFSSLLEHLKSVKALRFGSVTKSVIEEILNAAVYGDPYYSFSNLETLHVRNLCHDDMSNMPCSLSILDQMKNLSSLKNLKLDCKFGLCLQDDDPKLLERAFSNLTNFHSLSITTLKGLDAEQFSFIKHLTLIENLEIGSCESWTNCEDNANEMVTSSTNQSHSQLPNPDHKEKDPTESMKLQNDYNTSLRGGFSYLSELTRLRRLKLCDVIIDETSNQLSLSLKKMTNLRHLCLQGLTISPDASQTLDSLCSIIKRHLTNLRYLTIATNDPHTNKCVFELIKKLDSLDVIIWKVNASVEDSGECLVPFLKERGEESDMELDNVDLLCGSDDLEMMELNCLNNLLHSHLAHTHVEILPQ